KLISRLRYVDGDYVEPATFQALRTQLGAARRPAPHLHTPPAPLPLVVEQLAKSGCAKDGRVIVEKPFGTDRASAQTLNRILLGCFDEKHIFRLDQYLVKRQVHNI